MNKKITIQPQAPLLSWNFNASSPAINWQIKETGKLCGLCSTNMYHILFKIKG